LYQRILKKGKIISFFFFFFFFKKNVTVMTNKHSSQATKLIDTSSSILNRLPTRPDTVAQNTLRETTQKSKRPVKHTHFIVEGRTHPDALIN
jgi:hypothetical protein